MSCVAERTKVIPPRKMGAPMNLKMRDLALQIVPALLLFLLVVVIEHSNASFVAYLSLTLTNLLANIGVALFRVSREVSANCNGGRYFFLVLPRAGFCRFSFLRWRVSPRSASGRTMEMVSIL